MIVFSSASKCRASTAASKVRSSARPAAAASMKSRLIDMITGPEPSVSLSPGWSVKAEYLYADLGKMTCDAGVCGVETTFRPKINMVRAVVNVRF